jgi:hypothetical protein
VTPLCGSRARMRLCKCPTSLHPGLFPWPFGPAAALISGLIAYCSPQRLAMLHSASAVTNAKVSTHSKSNACKHPRSVSMALLVCKTYASAWVPKSTELAASYLMMKMSTHKVHRLENAHMVVDYSLAGCSIVVHHSCFTLA